jgi:sulfur-carrier protein
MLLEVRLFATLREYAPQEAVAGVFSVTLPDGGTVGTLLDAIGISAKKVHMRMVNGAGVEDGYALKDKDRVGLFPPVGGG